MILFTSQTAYRLSSLRVLKRWLKEIIEAHHFRVGNISYVFMSDDDLLKLNNDYLNHNYYTDILTFDYSSDNVISSDIFISIDRVRENANKYKVTFSQELLRVMVHGILHILGFKDKTHEEKQKMRKLEDIYINNDLVKTLKL